MAQASRETAKKELASRLQGLMPSRTAERVAQKPIFQAPRHRAMRTMLYDMGKGERELVSFPLEQLKAAGVEVPKMGKDAVFVSSGPDNGQLINKSKESVAFRFRGNEIICSVNGSAPIKIGLKGGNRVAGYV
jgi:hypothetical protein